MSEHRPPTEEELWDWAYCEPCAEYNCPELQRCIVEIRRLRALAENVLRQSYAFGCLTDALCDIGTGNDGLEEATNGLLSNAAAVLSEIRGETVTPEQARKWWEER